MIEIDNLIKESLKNKNTTELKVYRNLKSEILKFKTQKNAPQYDEEHENKILTKYCKMLEDSIKQFSEAGRDDLMSECREELDVVKKLLPDPVSLEKLYFAVEEYCQKHKFINHGELAIPKKNLGDCIKYIKKLYPSADNKQISDIVKENIWQTK